MGKYFIDKYSLLHFASGVIAYHFGLDITIWFLINIIFEMLENTPVGIQFIQNHLLTIWPGGKEYPDSIINSLGDIIFGITGWCVCYIIDNHM